MREKKIYPHAKSERRLIIGRPRPGGIKRLMKRVKCLDEKGHPSLPFNCFLEDLDKSE
ncbi:MAG: hypothetical protein UR51_C0006G0041 [Candidatus Moranbacteria bacterium GW2011_GWF1_34_10]|nr:MAG: hypothetical protein UR51_C0006G0041 [Candidatus Moranbacteria bacterium GW2011_GWF1_34_10]